MKRRIRYFALIAYVCGVFAVTCLMTPMGINWLFSGCDVHDEQETQSPDGKRWARWSTEGCHGLLLTTDFDSKVVIRESSGVEHKTLPVIFESDSYDPVKFTWIRPSRLNIEVPTVTEITQSLRSYNGIAITYSVPPSIFQSIADIESHLGHGYESLAPADRKTAERIDEEYRQYLSRFRDWIRLYASND